MSFTEQGLPSGQPAIKLRLVESCSHGWPSGTFFHLHTDQPKWSLGFYPGNFPPKLFSLFLQPALSQSVPNLCHFRVLEAALLQGTFRNSKSEKNLDTSVPNKFCLWALEEDVLTSRFGFWWYCQQWDLTQVCVFPNPNISRVFFSQQIKKKKKIKKK